MKVSVTTSHGTTVNLHPAHFQEFRAAGAGPQCEFAPMLAVPAAILDAAIRDGGLPTAVASVQMQHSAFGVLYACSDGHLVALLFDLGEPEVKRWLDSGHDEGQLPVIVGHGERFKVIGFAFDDDLDHMAGVSVGAQRATADDIMVVVQAMLHHLEQVETLAAIGIDVAKLRHGTVAVVVPSQVAAAGTKAH